MKTLVFSMLLIAASLSFLDTVHSKKHRSHVKRSRGATFQCIKACFTTALTEMANAPTTESDGKGTSYISHGVFNRQKLDAFCAPYAAFLTCRGVCGATAEETKSILRADAMVYNSWQAVCGVHHAEFQRLMPCLEKIFTDKVEDKCETKCEPKDGTRAERESAVDLARDDMKQATINELLAGMCDHISCNGRCLRDALKEKCTNNNEGRDAAQLLLSLQNELSIDVPGRWKSIAPEVTMPADCFNRPAPALKFRRALAQMEEFFDDVMLL